MDTRYGPLRPLLVAAAGRPPGSDRHRDRGARTRCWPGTRPPTAPARTPGEGDLTDETVTDGPAPTVFRRFADDAARRGAARRPGRRSCWPPTWSQGHQFDATPADNLVLRILRPGYSALTPEPGLPRRPDPGAGGPGGARDDLAGLTTTYGATRPAWRDAAPAQRHRLPDRGDRPVADDAVRGPRLVDPPRRLRRGGAVGGHRGHRRHGRFRGLGRVRRGRDRGPGRSARHHRDRSAHCRRGRVAGARGRAAATAPQGLSRAGGARSGAGPGWPARAAGRGRRWAGSDRAGGRGHGEAGEHLAGARRRCRGWPSAANAARQRSSIIASTAASAPVSVSTVRSAATPSGARCGSPRCRRTVAACTGSASVQRERDEHGPLALAQVVPGGLAGRRRVAEDAQHVVAELERLAQRHAVGGVGRGQLGRARRPAPRPGAAAARWCTSRS